MRLYENLQKAKSILKTNNIPDDNIEFNALKKLLLKNPGYLGKFTEWLFVDKIPFKRLEYLYDSIKDAKLNKPIDSFKDPEEIIDSIIRIDADVAINQIIKAIPSDARNFLMYNYREPSSNLRTTNEWNEIIAFLKQHLNKKNQIIKYLSKKGGQFNSDNFRYKDAIISFKKTLINIINPISINDILDDIDSNENIKLIHNDNKVLIISVNFAGLQKYGSSFWCITNNDTFEDYLTRDSSRWRFYGPRLKNQQWIVFFKNKEPFIDEKSVMGITFDYLNNDIVAAHWEDDDDSIDEANNLLSKIKISKKNIIDAYPLVLGLKNMDIYNFISNEDWILENLKNNPQKIFDAIHILCDFTISHFSLLKSVLDKYKIKLKIGKESKDSVQHIFTDLIESNLYKYLDLKNSMNVINDAYLLRFFINRGNIEILIDLIKNGYDKNRIIKEYRSLYYVRDTFGHELLSALYKEGIISISDIFKVDDNLSKRDLTKMGIDAYPTLLENRIYYFSLYKNLVKFFNKSKKNINKYREDLKAIIDQADRDHIIYTLDNIDDEDIEIYCIHKLHKKTAKYITRRVVEKLKRFDNF